jgi:HEPN domain-containing protein
MKEVEKWMEKAEKDLRAAEINLQQGLFEVAAFLSHQAAEKALKALYILKKKRLWKIHDLKQISIAVGATPEIVEMCKNLNPHYLATRYPLKIEV